VSSGDKTSTHKNGGSAKTSSSGSLDSVTNGARDLIKRPIEIALDLAVRFCGKARRTIRPSTYSASGSYVEFRYSSTLIRRVVAMRNLLSG
jgi:hypothetical protein